jgi:hypothetical protein
MFVNAHPPVRGMPISKETWLSATYSNARASPRSPLRALQFAPCSRRGVINSWLNQAPRFLPRCFFLAWSGPSFGSIWESPRTRTIGRRPQGDCHG